MSQMLKSSAAMATATLVSRILGLVREMVYARFMGTGWVASAFLFAFQIPNLFRRLLGEGALTAAFVPIFKAKEKEEGERAMWEAGNAVVSALLVAAAAIIGLGILVITVALQWDGLQDQTALMLRLLRWMFPYMLMMCLVAIAVGMLNARGQFFIPALGTSVLNLVMIASVIWLAPRMGTRLHEQVYALAFGVLAAGAAQALFQVPTLRKNGWRFRWVTPWKNPTVAEVARRMIPTTVGVAAYQLNIVATQGFAFWIGDSIVASFQYAVRLMELPQGLFGVSLATYLLPTLSGLASERKHAEFRQTLIQGLSHLVLINTLASVLLIALARPIVRLLFEGGLFQAMATENVAFALRLLAPGLVAFSGTGILARAFYALGDTKVPMQVSVFCLGLNTVISILLMFSLREGGLALANTLTSIANVLLLGYALRKKLPKLDFAGLGRESRTVVGTAVPVGIGVFFLGWWWESHVGSTQVITKLGNVAVPALVGSIVYFGALWLQKVPACRELTETLVGRLAGRRAPRGQDQGIASGRPDVKTGD
ncbi:MAG: murein biosynthesis integral membrane protein MurJ [Verrucomicrobiales bacterium]|nr:murein biosynthesis integral membrane protein MurJ [Verrucomicrobiales bacterium]